jgi:hypothetical protein
VIEIEVQVPERFALYPPRPNPSGGRIWIDLDVPRHDEAVLELNVYDVAGRRVRELIGGERPAGRHTMSWDLRDGGGRRVGAGVYFVVFQATEYRRTEKVLILR